MKRYLCPKCGQKEVLAKRKYGTCKACGYMFDIKQYSRTDMHHGKHMPKQEEKQIDKPTFISPDDDLVKKTPPINKKIKQHFEARVSAALNTIPNLWYMKIQVNPMAHHPTVGDFMILSENHNVVLECKEIDTNSNKQIPFKRFSQLHRMLKFKRTLFRNEAFMGILLWNTSFNDSDIYIIPVTVLEAHINMSNKKSINVTEVREQFENYKVKLNNLELYFKQNF